jgi:ribosomal protein S18 acetylase RimI-like enzyme
VREVLRTVAGHGLRCVQSRTIYRATGRRFASGITVTTASPADLECVQSRLTPGLSVVPPSPDHLISRFVAVRHGRVTGFVELVRHPPEDAPFTGHWLFSLTVLDPLFRGLGIGEALARRVIEIASDEGARELWLVVGETNRPAVALYRKLGFERTAIEELEEQLEVEARTTGRRRITMVKRLDG